MRISEIVAAKARPVVTVLPDDSVKTAASRIAEAHRGLAVVCDEANVPIGIISVIDVNRAVARYGDRAPAMPLSEVMHTDVAVCGPDDSVEEALETMIRRGIRHLPVVAEGRLQGIVQIQDLLQARFDEAQLGFEEMRRYVCCVGYH